MASYPPKKNTAFVFYVSLISQANTKIAQANPTLAAGDVKVATDDGAPGNLATLPVVDADFTKRVKVSLSAGEMNGDNVTVIFSDAAGAEWCDLTVNIQTVTRQIDDLAYPTTSGRSIDVDATGGVEITANQAVNVAQWAGAATATDDVALATAPTNFAALSITAGGLVDITQAAADKVWASATRTLTAFSTALAVSVWDVLESAIATASSIGLKVKTNLDAAVTTRASQTSVDNVQSDTDNIQTRLPATLVGGKMDSDMTAISGDTVAADNAESFFDGTGYGPILQRTTIATLATQTSFTLTDGSADNNAYIGCVIVIQDAATPVQKAMGVISAYTGATKTITLLNDPAVFTMAVTDIVTIIEDRSLKPTVDNRTLDVSTGGEAGLDWANVGSPTTAQNLSATNIDVDQIVASVSGAVGSVTGNVGGNVVGSVASVTADVGITQAGADKVWSSATRTLTALGASLVQEIWDRATSALTTVGSIGKLLVDNIDAAISSRATPAQVNTEVLDVLDTDTFAEPGQEAPAATQTIRKMLQYPYKAWRNRSTQTSTQYSLYNDDGTTLAQKSTVSDDGSVFDRGEVGSGP